MHPELEQLLVVGGAAGLGALVGIERELADKPAGLRCHMFVAAASAMFVLLGDAVVDEFQKQEGNSNLSSDPVRIIQAIVIGISFLGAGTIMHRTGQSRVEGLTTAAAILLSCGIGIAAARDLWWLAGGVAVMTLLVLLIVGQVERMLAATDHPIRDER